ncbi:diguanylate cyclase [Noviherbaspirillum sp. UKPF54]|uniref:sensor domain-containing diguanylate cyclase n=1 Tax=Noviherbaspirillum sp. UKPF54 TaxID=2601898 RepID=UPI0011B194F5|nr:diguanylate cyclase [Noviherbaspirillum sp. UKPF54]QDZ28452.1 diguanylate cyclase [Noviherbaspirillum sp. UKPF54]
MKIFFRGNLKARLVLLILMAMTPAFALYVFNSYRQMETQKENAREAALRLVRVMKASHMQMIDDAKGELKAMSQLPSLRGDGKRRCNLLRSELAPTFPGYGEIGLARPNGDIICLTSPSRLNNNVAGMPFFSDTIVRHDVGVGPYEIDAVTLVPRVFIGVPVTGATTRVEAVLFASLSLSQFELLPPAAQLSRDSVILIFDDSGLILARYPDSQGWRGTRRIADSPLVRSVRGSLDEEGVNDLMGADDVSRLFAFAKIHRTPKQTAYLAIGIPTAVAYAGANSAFQSNMLNLALVSLLALGIAWVGSHRLVVRKMRSLIRVSDRIRNGDFGARSGVARTGDEVGQLAAAIDDMAHSIQSRVAELQRHGDELRELKEMNDALQSCVTQDEVLAIVRQFALRLFPDQPGMLYLMHSSGDHLEAKSRWNDPAAMGEFLPQDCWAVRRGKMYRVEAEGNQPRCHHVQEPPPGNYVCVPLMVQGEMLGVLHIENDRAGSRSREQPLVQAVAEHTALTLANLRLRDTLHAQAMRDGLTGLFNRRFMEESLSREMRNAQRNKSPVAIVMIDIDHFKRFNDTFGHAAGDMLLREVGGMLQRQMRGGDLACRYGGEEFTVILPATALRNAAELAEKLRDSARGLSVTMDGHALGQITISLGVASFPEHGDTWEAVLHAADIALMQAKHTRNRTMVYGAEEAPEPEIKVGT